MQLEVITRKPKAAASSTPILFVHAAWHGAWCWENFLPYFAETATRARAFAEFSDAIGADDLAVQQCRRGTARSDPPAPFDISPHVTYNLTHFKQTCPLYS